MKLLNYLSGIEWKLWKVLIFFWKIMVLIRLGGTIYNSFNNFRSNMNSTIGLIVAGWQIQDERGSRGCGAQTIAWKRYLRCREYSRHPSVEKTEERWWVFRCYLFLLLLVRFTRSLDSKFLKLCDSCLRISSLFASHDRLRSFFIFLLVVIVLFLAIFNHMVEGKINCSLVIKI